MNELKVFQNSEFGTLRGVEIDGESWLVGKCDQCACRSIALGLLPV